MSSQFYLFFFTRRLIFGFTQVYLTHSISIQYSILLSSSLVQLGFLFYYKPFKEKHIQISVIAGEISTTLFIFLSIFFTCNLSISETAALESIMVYEVIIGVLVQFLVAIYAFWLGIKKVLLKFRKYRNKKKQTAPNITLQQE